jgi:AMP nucleosidase
LRHYTGTDAEHFQNFVLLTNYQFYVDEFVALGRQMMASGAADYDSLVEPGNLATHNHRLGERTTGQAAARLPQMPAYHLTRPDHSGITLVNIGVGPSNAKTITDHIAVLRPHAWVMLGHCAGLRQNQRLGDFVLAHGYVREDHVLDADLPTWVPVPPLAEVQIAMEQAVAEVTGLVGYELKSVMRTGTVASVDNRNWELRHQREPVERFTQSRAIAVDMESATIATNGFRFRVPYGTLLCVSDKPLHGEIKLPGMADAFYRTQVDQHLKIGLRTMERLRDLGQERLHSRKLRSFTDAAFQ